MSRQMFFKKLIKQIESLPEEEKEDVLTYYNQYFDEAGSENEEKVIEELGTPEEVASKILEDFNLKNNDKIENVKNKGLPTWAIVLIAIFAVPIGIPLLIALLAVVFALAISIFAIIFSLFVTGFALILSSGLLFVISIVMAFIHFPTSLMLLGSSMVIIGVGTLLSVGTYQLSKLVILLIKKIFSKRGDKNEK